MLDFIELGPTFGHLIRPVAHKGAWPSPFDPQRTYELAALALFDATREGDDESLQRVLNEVERVAITLHAWTPDRYKELRSRLWRAAHAYIVEHVDDVDRGVELDIIARLLGVDRR